MAKRMGMTEKVRKQTVEDFLKVAQKVRSRDSWFIGGFLGAVMDEWEFQEAKRRAGKPKEER